MPPNATGRRTAGRGSSRRNQGQSRRDYLLGNKISKSGNSDAAVPLLQFGARNNWLKFKDKMYTACVEKYGDLGRLIETKDNYMPAEILETEYPNWQTDELQKMLYLDAQKARAKAIREMNANRSKMYAYILSKLSNKSMDEIKHHEDYGLIQSAMSLKGLWIVLREIQASNSSTTNVLILKKEAYNTYASCKQGQYGSLADFKERFDFC